MHPLREDTAGCEILFDPRIELLGEQSRHSAHPRVTRLGDDQVETTTRTGEIRSRVIDHEMRARIAEHAIIHGQELSRGANHLRLDFDRGQLAQVWAAEQHVRRHARALAYDRGGFCAWSMR